MASDIIRRMSARLGDLTGHTDTKLMISPEERRNSRLLTAEAPFTGVSGAAITSLVSLFVIQLGATDRVVGWLTSGPALISLLWLIPCGRLVQRVGRYAQTLSLAALVTRFLLISLGLVPFLPPAWRPWAVVAIMSLRALPSGAWVTSMYSACGEMFSSQNLPRLMSRRWAAYYATVVVCTPILGKLADVLVFPTGFQWVFAVTGGIALMTVWFFAQLRTPPCPAEEPAVPAPGKNGSSPTGGQLRRYRPFALFEVGIIATFFAWFAAVPLFPLYWVRELGANGVWMGGLVATNALGAALGSLFWGRWSRPQRERRGAWLAILGAMTIYPWLAATFHSLAPQLVCALLAGFSYAGVDVFLFNRMIQLSTRRERPTLVAMHNVIVNVASFVAPLVSTGVGVLFGVRTALMLAGGLGVIGGGLIYLLGWNRQTDE